jgi:hypothetical protein
MNQGGSPLITRSRLSKEPRPPQIINNQISKNRLFVERNNKLIPLHLIKIPHRFLFYFQADQDRQAQSIPINDMPILISPGSFGTGAPAA